MMDNSEKPFVNSNFLMEMVRGRVRGATPIHKFGEARDLLTGQFSNVWDGTSDEVDTVVPIYTYSTTADIDTVSSGSALDTGQTVEIQGLDGNLDPVVQTITTNGQSKVTLPRSLLRVFRVKNLSLFGKDILDNLYVYVDTAVSDGVPVDGTKIRAIIRDGHNQTQMAQYTVPRGYSLYIIHGWANISKAGGATAVAIELKIRQREYDRVWRELHKTVLISSGSSDSNRPYVIPLKLEGMHEIEYLGRPTTSGLSMAAGFHGMLLREDYQNSSPIVYL